MRYITLTTVMALTFFACSSTAKTSSSNSDLNTEDSVVQVINLAQADLEKTLALDTNIVIIDVRTPKEVSEGYIPQAGLFIDFNGSSFESEMAKLDKSKTYVMYCRSGGRSGKASNYMVENGFRKVYNLEGGVLSYKGTLAK